MTQRQLACEQCAALLQKRHVRAIQRKLAHHPRRAAIFPSLDFPACERLAGDYCVDLWSHVRLRRLLASDRATARLCWNSACIAAGANSAGIDFAPLATVFGCTDGPAQIWISAA